MPSLWDPGMLRELIVGARAWPSAAVPAQRNELARLSSRNRPGHDLDAGYPVRYRADAGRECAAGIYPDLSGARSGRARSRRHLVDDGVNRARRDCARRSAGQRNRRPRHHQLARDHDRLGAGHGPPHLQCHRLAGSADGGRLRRTAAGRTRAGDHGAHRTRVRSLFFSHQDRLAARPRGRRACGRAGRPARLRDGGQFLVVAAHRRQGTCERCHQCRAYPVDGYSQRKLGRGPLRTVRRPQCPAAGDTRLRGRLWHHRSVRRADPHFRARRRPAGRDGGTGLLRAWHDEVDLRHRLLRTAQHRGSAGDVEESPSDDRRLPARWHEGAIFIAGAAVQWLRDALKVIGAASDVNALAAAADPAEQLYLVPAFVGLGAPWWDAQARGALYGLTRKSGVAELARAALEAVGYQTRDLLEAMRADWPGAGANTVLRVDGGMAASDVTMQFVADILAAPVDRPVVMETTALGAAYLAGYAAGLCPDLPGFAAMWRCERRFEPGMDVTTRERKWAGWREAVARTLSRG